MTIVMIVSIEALDVTTRRAYVRPAPSIQSLGFMKTVVSSVTDDVRSWGVPTTSEMVGTSCPFAASHSEIVNSLVEDDDIATSLRHPTRMILPL